MSSADTFNTAAVVLAGPGLRLVGRMVNEDGTLNSRQLNHVMALGSYYCVMIGRQKLARFPGTKAELPCGFCGIEATNCGGQIYVKGYAEPQRHARLLDAPREVLANDADLWIKDRRVHCPSSNIHHCGNHATW